MKRLVLLLAVFWGFAATANDIAPEPATPIITKKAVSNHKAMVVTANPYATDIATSVLKNGGNAMDAALAAQFVLSIVEPQSSGLGGGGFLLHWDAETKQLRSYDGRETAPSTAKPDDFLQKNGSPMSFLKAVKSKEAIGIPGLLDMLWMAHQNHGNLSWGYILQYPEKLARNGFKVSSRLHKSIQYAAKFNPSDAFKTIYYQKGKPYPKGATLKNLKQASFIRLLRAGYRKSLRSRVAAELNSYTDLKRLPYKDFKNYQAKERKPLCGSYRDYKICSMAPPSSGGLAILQTLKLLEPFELQTAYDPQEIHLILEAQKLAFADRNHFVADPDFVKIPIDDLLSNLYLSSRSMMIDLEKTNSSPAHPGSFVHGPDHSHDAPSTTHLSIIDKHGNAVSLTSSVEHSFGSSIVSEAHGIVMNNQLTDFSFVPEAEGKPIANRMEAGKRPRSSMSPTMVFKDDKLHMVLGSPGGSSIIGYVLKTLIAVLDWNMPLQEAINAPNFLHKNKGIAHIEKGFKQNDDLKIFGHKLKTSNHTSGVSAILVQEDGRLEGATDPRREGKARGF